MARDSEMDALLTEFATKVTALIEDRATKRLQALVAPLMQGGGTAITFSTRARQTCPVPGCNNTAAPRYGMVCVAHKDLPKGEIKRFREERKTQQGVQQSSNGTPPPALPPAPAKRRRRAAVPG